MKNKEPFSLFYFCSAHHSSLAWHIFLFIRSRVATSGPLIQRIALLRQIQFQRNTNTILELLTEVTKTDAPYIFLYSFFLSIKK